MKLPREAQWGLIACGIGGGISLISILGATELTKSDMVSGKAALAISTVIGATCGLVTSYAVGMSDRGSGPIASLPPSEPAPNGRQPIDQAMEMLGSHPASKIAVYNAAVGRGEETSRLYQNALALDQALRESQHLFPEPKPEPSPVTAWEVQGSPVTEHVIHPGHDWEPDPDPLPEELFSEEPIGNDDPWEEVTPRTQIQAPGPNVGW